MPKGRQPKGGHKGRNRRFVTEEEVRQQEEKKQREKEWKKKKGLGGDSDSEGDESDEGAKALSRGAPGDLPPSDSESEEYSNEEEEEPKAKGVEGLIEIQNPNRVVKKVQKAKDVDVNAKVELTRKEREEIERQKAAQAYRKLHEAGKTDEARKDMARLAIIRQQREEAAKRREVERKAKEEAEKKEKAKN